MRESVDVMRLSRIALSNLEKDGEGADYTAAQARGGDVVIDSADAELDFEEVREEGGWVVGCGHSWLSLNTAGCVST